MGWFAGDQPVNQVISDLKRLHEGAVYAFLAPIIPVPLIDKATSLGIDHWVNHVNSEQGIVFFRQNPNEQVLHH